MSFNYPHPPLVPLECYLDLYKNIEIPEAHIGDWAGEFEELPYALKLRRNRWPAYHPREIEIARRAFYAQCTQIDHQIRLVVGVLREEKLLDDTIILFTCDHGDMLGNHGMYAKSVCYEESAGIPMILVPAVGDSAVALNRIDNRLVEHRDIMPTLLDMTGLPIPESVEGLSMVGEQRREYITSEHYENDAATRMIRNERFKLIYYPVGNRTHLFDLEEDPLELRDLSQVPDVKAVKNELEAGLIESFYGDDLSWVENGKLKGLPDKEFVYEGRRDLNSQRGWRFMGG
jgi:arylsulfatase A-like enzyme